MAKINKSSIGLILRVYFKNSEIEEEYRFHPVRRFRFDFAIPKLKIAIEYEGIMSAKSRHSSVKGYTKDCEKYNLAVVEGWRVLRYTALNISQLPDDINAMRQKVIDKTLYS